MFTLREVKTEKMILHLEIELNKSTITPEEAAERIQLGISSYRFKGFSDFIVGLLRETKSSTYEIKRLSID